MKYKIHKVLAIVLCIAIILGSFQISKTEVHAAGGNLSSLINIQGAQGYLWIPENITSDTGFVWCMPGNGNGGTYEYFTGGTACTKHVVFFVKYQDNQGNEWCSLYTKVPDIINELKSTYNLSGMSNKLYYYGYSQGSWRFGWNSNYVNSSNATYGFSSLNIWDEAILNDGGSVNAINVGRLSRVYVVQGGAERHKAEYDTKFGNLGSNYTIFDDPTMKHYPTDPNRPGPLNAKDYGMLTIGLDWFGGNSHSPTPTPSPNNPTSTPSPDNPTTTPTPTSGDTPTGYSGLGGYGIYYNYFDMANDTGSNSNSADPAPDTPTPTPGGPSPTPGDSEPTPTPTGSTPPPWAGDYPSREQVDGYLTSIGVSSGKKNSLLTCYEQGVERGWPLPEICGLMANVNAEGQSGVIEYAFSRYHYFDFYNPSGKDIITTGEDIEYLLSWPSSHPEGVDNHYYNGKGPYSNGSGGYIQYDSCGVGWIGYSQDTRITYCNNLKNNMSGVDPTPDELVATDTQMLYDYYFTVEWPKIHPACADLNAYDCAYKQCVDGIRPANKKAEGVTRGNWAQDIYDAINSL